MKLPKLFAASIFLLSFALHVYVTKAQKIDLKIEGSIVMYDRFPPGAWLNMCGGTSTYVLKISKITGGEESSEYILMFTGHTFSKSDFDGKKTLPFNLIRVPAFDENVRKKLIFAEATKKRKAIPWLLLSKGVGLEDIPLDKTLPAYLFMGNDYPVKWWKRKKA